MIALMNELHIGKIDKAKELGGTHFGTVFRRMRTESGVRVQRAEVRFDGFAGCLRTPGGGSSKQFVIRVDRGRTAIRALTVRECANLMGLPDSYKLPATKGTALKLVGDGVVVPVVRFLADNLLERLAQGSEIPKSHGPERTEKQLAYAR
jgi:DNA (cytosine-5)-methyltransferase 1